MAKNSSKGSAKKKAATPKGRRICVLGYAEETRDFVYDLTEDDEVWGINMAHHFTYATDSNRSNREIPLEEAGAAKSKKKDKDAEALPNSFAGAYRLDRPRTLAPQTNWFQLHPEDWGNLQGKATGHFGRPIEHRWFLQQFPGTIWMRQHFDDIPNSVAYPLDDIVAASGRRFFTSTFAYMLGLIWYQHKIENNPVERVYLYGINLTSVDEYIHQKSCVEYWCGRLEEAGIEVVIPNGSALLKGKLYALDGDKTNADLSDHAFERVQVAKEKYMRSWANVNTMMAIKQDMAFWAKRLSNLAAEFPDSFTPELNAAIQATLDKRAQAINAIIDQNQTSMSGDAGKLNELQHWLSLTGGIDHKAPKIPPPVMPSEALQEDFGMPQMRSI